MFLLKLKEDYPWPREIHPLPKCPTITCETVWEKFLTEDSEHFLMKLKESRNPEVGLFFFVCASSSHAHVKIVLT